MPLSLIQAPNRKGEALQRRVCQQGQRLYPDFSCASIDRAMAELDSKPQPMGAPAADAPHLANRLQAHVLQGNSVETTLDQEIQRKVQAILTKNLSYLRNHNVHDSAADKEGKMLAEAAALDEAKAGEEGGDGSDMETFKRQRFDALVTWQTDIPVINGQAVVNFKLNDSLTKLKVFAVVQDPSQKFGTGETSYLSAQEVQSFPNMPPVSRTGDNFPVTVTLQNNGDASDSFKVTVSYRMLDANG